MAQGYGMTQAQVNGDRVLHIAGTRVLSAPKNQALPTMAQVTQGNEPSGYIDHGSILAGRVELNATINRQAINLGRIATPARFYAQTQTGQVRFTMQEYQPEQIDLASGGTGTPETISGGVRVYIGGKLGSERRILLLDDFDTNPVDDAEPWQQYWYTNPNAQSGGTYTRAEENEAYVVPAEYELLAFVVSGINRLLEFRAVEA